MTLFDAKSPAHNRTKSQIDQQWQKDKEPYIT